MRDEPAGSSALGVKIGAALGLGGLALFARMGDTCLEVGRVGAKVAADVPLGAASHGIDDAANVGLDVARHGDDVTPFDVIETAFDVGDLTLQVTDLAGGDVGRPRTGAARVATATEIPQSADGLVLVLTDPGADLPAVVRSCLAVGTWCLASERATGVEATFLRAAATAEREHKAPAWVFETVAATGTPAAWLTRTGDEIVLHESSKRTP